jgi:hypothetical protein
MQLVLESEVVAYIEHEGSFDGFWLEGRYRTAGRFDEVRELLERELELVEGGGDLDVEAWEAVWDELHARGLALVLDDGRRVGEFAAHLYPDGTARIRWTGG